MTNGIVLGITFLAFALAACADGGHGAGEPTMFLDMGAITAETDLAPVNGIRAAGQPDAATLERLADAGYVAVIDLRAADEDRGMAEQAVVESLGLDYLPLPIADADDVNFDNAQRLDEMLARYQQPVLVHCASGNRVGALLALRESLAGTADAEALEFGRQSGLTRLEPVVTERLKGR